MTVTGVVRDVAARTLTITSRFEAPVERVWEVWSDPRRLERWWGPPDYPATVTHHDLTPGGTVVYEMTGPDGDRHGGRWRVRSVEPPHRLEFEDGVGNPDTPTGTVRVTLSAVPGGGTEMVMTVVADDDAGMQWLVTSGSADGMAAAAGQIDALLA